MLTQADVLPYLIDRGLLGLESLVDGGIMALDVSRRNRNYKVVSSRGPSYLLKQGISPESAATVAREAALYSHLAASPETAALWPYLPRCYGYDAERRILILELVQGAADLRHGRGRRRRLSPRVAGAVGAALAAVHGVQGAGAGGSGVPAERIDPAWVLAVHRLDRSALTCMNAASLQMVRMLQRFQAVCELLDALRTDWATESFIHNDVRWDNLLLVSRPQSRKAEVKIVDWELAGWGDPCWDVGAVFVDYLVLWLSSTPITGEAPLAGFAEHARFPLSAMQPALRAFWRAYVRRRRLGPEAARARLARSVRLCGARLIQSVYEQLQISPLLTGNLVCQLQLSWNLLAGPEEAVRLLGLEPREGGAA